MSDVYPSEEKASELRDLALKEAEVCGMVPKGKTLAVENPKAECSKWLRFFELADAYIRLMKRAGEEKTEDTARALKAEGERDAWKVVAGEAQGFQRKAESERDQALADMGEARARLQHFVTDATVTRKGQGVFPGTRSELDDLIAFLSRPQSPRSEVVSCALALADFLAGAEDSVDFEGDAVEEAKLIQAYIAAKAKVKEGEGSRG